LSSIGLAAFGGLLLALGLVSVANPSGVRLFGERLGGRMWLSKRTVDRSIRASGVLAIVVASIAFWNLMSG